MSAKLYGVSVSHPSHAARAMLELKGIDYELHNFPAGMQPVGLRLAGFRGRKVPGLKIDGRRVQGTLAISRLLDELEPDPPLFPADRRAAVEEAEAWGEREFQPLPRRFFRWAMAHDGDLRRQIIENVAKFPVPAVTSRLVVPQLRYFAYVSRANDENTRAGLAKLPGALDHIDELIADGTIGRPGAPNAADFQIASTVAVLLLWSDLKPAIEHRPAAELANRLFPPRSTRLLPPFLPAEWLTPLRPK